MKELSMASEETITHFMECNWPICVSKKEANAIKKELDFIKVKKTNEHKDRPYRLTLKGKKIPSRYEANYWRTKYEWESQEVDRLYSLAKKMCV
jgi:hypothetical protein